MKLKIVLINVNVLSSFWGWGGEDDDLYYRVRNRKLNVTKLSSNLGRFKVGSANCTWAILSVFFLLLFWPFNCLTFNTSQMYIAGFEPMTIKGKPL